MTPQEQFLLEDDHPSVKNYLAYLQAEREAQKKREAATGDTKVPAWISLHMQVAEKRHSSSTGDVGSVVVVFSLKNFSFPKSIQALNTKRIRARPRTLCRMRHDYML
jgi:hypothetical protein